MSVALVARQPGTLHAFEILRKHLLQKGCRVRAFNLNPQEQHPDFVSISDVHSFQSQVALDVQCLITGTSLQSEADSEFWSWAREQSVSSFAFVDQWVNLAQRFEKIQTAPDAILVPEENVVPDIQALRLGSQIHVVGTPVWDILRKISRDNKVRGLVVFATEPASAAGGQEAYRSLNGYDDMDSLEMAIRFLTATPRADRQKWQLEIKLHPIDNASRVQSKLATLSIPENVTVSISSKTKKEILEQADFIFGNRSMLLVEASLIGIYVISFQPGRRTTSPATDREGISVVTQAADFQTAVRDALKNKPHLPSLFSCEAIFQVLKASRKIV